jgi:hypothetical protein
MWSFAAVPGLIVRLFPVEDCPVPTVTTTVGRFHSQGFKKPVALTQIVYVPDGSAENWKDAFVAARTVCEKGGRPLFVAVT